MFGGDKPKVIEGNTMALGVASRRGFVDVEPEGAFGTLTFGRRVYDPSLRRWLSPDPLLLTQPERDLSGVQWDLWGYAGNNPVKNTDISGLFPEEFYNRARTPPPAAEQQPTDPSLQLMGEGAFVGLTMATGPVGDSLAAARSLSVLADDPSWRNAAAATFDVVAAAVPGLPALGVLARSNAITDPSRLLPTHAGPVAHIAPSEVVGKTPAQIDEAAKRLGLQPKGPDPMNGKGAYIDPQTGEQRILSSPRGDKSNRVPHGHINDPSGQYRVGPNGDIVDSDTDAAHLKINVGK